MIEGTAGYPHKRSASISVNQRTSAHISGRQLAGFASPRRPAGRLGLGFRFGFRLKHKGNGVTTFAVSNGAEKREMTENKIRTAIIECAIEVHRELGPGLLETVYEVALLKDGIVRAVNGLEEHLCAPASLREKNKFQSALHSTRTSRASELYDMRERKMKFCKPQISQRAQRVRGEKKIN